MLQVETEKPGDVILLKTRLELIFDILVPTQFTGKGFQQVKNSAKRLNKLSNSDLFNRWEKQKVNVKTHKFVQAKFPNDPSTYCSHRGEGFFRIVLRKVK